MIVIPESLKFSHWLSEVISPQKAHPAKILFLSRNGLRMDWMDETFSLMHGKKTRTGKLTGPRLAPENRQTPKRKGHDRIPTIHNFQEQNLLLVM